MIFTVELILNICANFFWDFVLDGWNIFDLVIIVISILQLALSAIPAVRSLRTFRTFRIIRMFGKLKRLRTIINAIFASIIPVLQTLAICLIVVAGDPPLPPPPSLYSVRLSALPSFSSRLPMGHQSCDSCQSTAAWELSSSAPSRREISVRDKKNVKRGEEGCGKGGEEEVEAGGADAAADV